jgi:hypothetical protein
MVYERIFPNSCDNRRPTVLRKEMTSKN